MLMGARIEGLGVSSTPGPLDLLKAAQDRDADYLVIERQPGAASPEPLAAVVAVDPVPDIVIVIDPVARSRWQPLRQQLPASLYLMSALPDQDRAMAFSTTFILRHADSVGQSASLAEAAIRLAAEGRTAFAEASGSSCDPDLPEPALTTSDADPSHRWLRPLIERMEIPGLQSSSTPLVALKAGLFLIHDFCEESHSRSQSIEGLGKDHTGDYWHAILHRREPDYGNAKYWFRHVGRHPVFTPLAEAVRDQFSTAAGSLVARLEPWKGRLIPAGRWDPFAFVDLCAAAENEPELRAWCEHVQLSEMLLLLEFSYRDAIAD